MIKKCCLFTRQCYTFATVFATTESRIFVLDDDPAFRARVREGLGGMFGLVEAGSEEEFRKAWRPRTFDLLLLDMRLRVDREGLDVLREVFSLDELQPVIMVSAYGDAESAIEAVGAGAMMFLHKHEFSPALLGRMAEAVIEQGRLKRQVAGLRRTAWAGEPDALLGNSPEIREAGEMLRALARSGRVPLVSGERGTGMTLAARLIHRSGEQADGPFLEVAGAVAEEGRAFYEGRFSPWAQASGGTLALDGVETMSEKAGRGVLERTATGRGEYITPSVVLLLHEGGRRVGKPGRWLGAGDLLPVRLPPLRERREDIPLLAAHFLQGQRAGGHTTARSFGSYAMERLEAHTWPGNVRELRNAVGYGALQAAVAEVDEIGPEHLPGALVAGRQGSGDGPVITEGTWDYLFQVARAELALAERAMREKSVTQKTALARALGYTDRFTLGRRLEKALGEFPDLAADYPSVARLFRKGGGK